MLLNIRTWDGREMGNVLVTFFALKKKHDTISCILRTLYTYEIAYDMDMLAYFCKSENRMLT